MWLAIETAGDRASVALGDSAAEAIEENFDGARRHASMLLPMVAGVLHRAGASLADVDGLALSDGPGSFTGLRVGAAVAKALVSTRGFPLWTAPSLMVRARGAAPDGATVLAVSNALRGEVYAAAYRFQPDRVDTLLPPTVCRPESLMEGSICPGVLVGDVTPSAADQLSRWSGRALIVPPQGAPRASDLLRLVGRPGGAVGVLDVEAWEPTYGRPAEAQARWESAHGRPLPDPAGRPG